MSKVCFKFRSQIWKHDTWVFLQSKLFNHDKWRTSKLELNAKLRLAWFIRTHHKTTTAANTAKFFVIILSAQSLLSSDFRQTPHPRLECNAVSSGIKLTGNWTFIFNLGENMYKIRWRNLGIYFGEKWKSNPYLKLINNKHSQSSELLNLYLQHFLTSAKAKWNNLSFVNYIFLTPDLHLSAAAKSQT